MNVIRNIFEKPFDLLRILRLVFLICFYSLYLTKSATAEELLGEPLIPGQEFPRQIGGFSLSEGDYAINVRDCAVALYLMDRPVSGMDELIVSLQIERFIEGAAYVSARQLSLDDFLGELRKDCRSRPASSLAESVNFTAQRFILETR